ncbi:MAG: Na+ dependent nucleoside transporter [Bacteroidales bacterium]|nr:Na+ dependent nucleoside transporter [Bacteroidales bacterium]MBN2818888.1 Na+ dependent nucleoside transporter [Bacteroidales bacterium]
MNLKILILIPLLFISISIFCQQEPSGILISKDSAIVLNQDNFVLLNQTVSEQVETTNRGSLIFRGLIGIIFLIGISFIFSKDRKAVQYKIVFLGLMFQILLAISVLYIPVVESVFSFIGKLFVVVLNCADKGAEFLFGDMVDLDKTAYIFAFQVLPAIIFFSALMSLLFYLGIIQKVVFVMAWLLKKTLKMSGPESLAVAGNVFLGQTESPLLIKAYLPKLSGSEMFIVMTSGMATIAGAVLAAYVGMLGGDDPVAREMFARHLVTASVMAAPGAVVVSKILFPQTESIDKPIKISKDQVGSNPLDAISTGAYEGLKLAANVAIMLLVFYSFIALLNILLGFVGKIPVHQEYAGSINEVIAYKSDGMFTGLSLEYLLGKIFTPLMWLIGVANDDLSVLGRLMGEKLIFTEFVGYSNLKDLMAQGAIQSSKSVLMATYMLCGFANIASVGILIGGIGSLAPNQRVFLSKQGMRALLGGTIASLLSATIIGVIA